MTEENNATPPKRVTADGVTVEQHSLREQLDYEQRKAADKAAKSRSIGIRFLQFRHRGARR